MRNNVLSMFAKLVFIPAFVFTSLNSFASSSQDISIVKKSTSELSQSLSTDLKKSRFSYISKKLSQFNLPRELAIIPVIESDYNTRAKSNKGAGGLWQLMPATAKQFGISSRQRFQLEPSTTAALNYFHQLHQKFKNWEFAIAAYNAGDGRVQKALKKNPSATTVQELNLPKETKLYVQKFIRMQGELKTYDV